MSSLLDSLKFAARAIAASELHQGSAHLRIERRRVLGFNGVLTMSAPVDLGFDAAPLATTLIRALEAATDVVALTQESATRLQVKAGKLRVAVPCLPLAEAPQSLPAGLGRPLGCPLREALMALRPFVGTDATRPWACGIQIRNDCAFATNNVIVVQRFLGAAFQQNLNLPVELVDEIIAEKEEPNTYQTDGSSLTLNYADGRWIKSQLLALDGPDMAAVLDKTWVDCDFCDVKTELVEAIKTLDKFGDYVYSLGDKLATEKDATSGTSVEMSMDAKGKFSLKHLKLVLKAATHMNLKLEPKPGLFVGDRLRGAIVSLYAR